MEIRESEMSEKLKLKYKYITFQEYKKEGVAYLMYNRKASVPIGSVFFYETWKQFVVEFVENCVFNCQCLNDIANFLETLNRRPK